MKIRMTAAIMIALAGAASAQTDDRLAAPPEPSALEDRLKEEAALPVVGRTLTTHRPTYILPATYSFNPSDKPLREINPEEKKSDEFEVKFQISLKALLAKDVLRNGADLYAGYTQLSLWQAYNTSESAPVRDTNYEPEVFMTFDTDIDVLGLHNRMITAGVVHQSNGRGSEELSRNWNRIYASFLFDSGPFLLVVKPWYRIPEDKEEDGNPRMYQYMGYGDVRMAYKMGEMEFATILRNNLNADDNKGAVQLDWTFPLVNEIRGYLQYFNGYGETLLDYDHSDQRIGVGFMLGDWL